MGGGEQKVPTHNRCYIMFQPNFNSSLLFGIQNIIFKAQNKKSYTRYADLSILLTNGRELWQICGFMICSKLRAWRGMRICQYCSKCEGVKAILWIYDMFKTESLTRFADLSILFKM